jgi:RNA polymerase sigma factor (sigma-70 family)
MKMIRDDIALNNYRLVIKVACRYLNLGVSLDDLEQEGRMGLLKAINKFEPNGKKFSTMAVPWIRQAVIRALEKTGSTIRIPANMNIRIYKIKRIIAQLESEYGIEEPGVDLIYEKCQENGLPYNKDQIKAALSAKQISNPTSIDKTVGEDEDSPLIEFLTSEKDEKTEDYAERTSMIEGIKKILDNYVEKEKNVANKYVQLTFGDPKKKKHIILISDKEYDALVDKKLSRDEKRKRFQEFLDRYGFTPEYTFEGKKEISISSGERKALVYAYRTGLSYGILKENVYLTAERFLNRRNYNGVLFPESKSDTRLVLTLDDTGKLFDLTRERIRQIVEKVGDEVRPFIENTSPIIKISHSIHLDDSMNIYKMSDFNSLDPGFEMTVKTNDNIELDENGNITPLKTGKSTINVKTDKARYEITITVKPIPNKYVRGPYKKKLIPREDNIKDSQ